MHTTAHTPIDYLERSARLFPSKTAVIDEFGTCTYAELLERSRAIAQGLLAARARSNASGTRRFALRAPLTRPRRSPSSSSWRSASICSPPSSVPSWRAASTCRSTQRACRASAKRLCHPREWETERKRPDRDRERRYHNRGAGNLSGRPRSARGRPAAAHGR